jgi:thioredoxin 1
MNPLGPAPTRKDEGTAAMASPNVKEITNANFKQEVLDSATPVLVDFWAEWCPPCKMLAPILDEIANEYKGKAIIGKLDTDENREVSVQYSIAAIPTMIIFRRGQVVNRLVGYKPKSEITAALDAAAAG